MFLCSLLEMFPMSDVQTCLTTKHLPVSRLRNSPKSKHHQKPNWWKCFFGQLKPFCAKCPLQPTIGSQATPPYEVKHFIFHPPNHHSFPKKALEKKRMKTPQPVTNLFHSLWASNEAISSISSRIWTSPKLSPSWPQSALLGYGEMAGVFFGFGCFVMCYIVLYIILYYII